jgi:pimeloyl-ACP methyl ester carboxylesterase
MMHRTLSVCLLTAFGFLAAPHTFIGQNTPAASGAAPKINGIHYPGEQMIDVGGRKIQLLHGGQDSPTVIFENGLGGKISDWDKVRPVVDKFASTVCYSRAGTPPSDDPAPGPRTPLMIADDLHELLQQAGIKPPYVLVGHSFGGMIVRAFAIKHPDEVIGLVLVDTELERGMVAARAIDPHATVPTISDAERAAASPGILAELEGSNATLAAGNLGVSGDLPNVPVAVITSLQDPSSRLDAKDDPTIKMKRQLQSDIFQSETYGMHIVTDRSPHNIMRTEPELVITAIRFVIDAPKKPEVSGTPKPVEITLTDAQTDPILGNYTVGPGVKITISREADHLYMQQTGVPTKMEIGAESETEFFLKQYNMEITFTKSADGKVKSMTVLSGGHNQELPKAP